MRGVDETELMMRGADETERMMRSHAVVALAFTYPSPGHLEALRGAVATLDDGPVRRSMERFVEAVAEMDLGRWEELHTATLDLSPKFVPYVGHVTWGESYRRGEFMADLKADMDAHGVALDGELPDHLGVVLRYVDAVPEPREDLMEVLAESVASMTTTLAKADKHNPYRHVLAACAAAVGEPTPVRIGERR